MRHLLILAVFLALGGLVGPQSAFAFSFENQGTSQPSSSAPGGKAGYVDTDPGALMPPIGRSIEGSSLDFGPGSRNNGMAAQPDRGSSVGPSWLYPPSR